MCTQRIHHLWPRGLRVWNHHIRTSGFTPLCPGSTIHSFLSIATMKLPFLEHKLPRPLSVLEHLNGSLLLCESPSQSKPFMGLWSLVLLEQVLFLSLRQSLRTTKGDDDVYYKEISNGFPFFLLPSMMSLPLRKTSCNISRLIRTRWLTANQPTSFFPARCSLCFQT